MIDHNLQRTLRSVFLNCYNLDPYENQSDGAAVSVQQNEQKLRDLAAYLRQSTDKNPPDVIGICEVGSSESAHELASAVSQETYQILWSDVPRIPGTMRQGIVILYRPEILSPIPDRFRRFPDPQATMKARCNWMAQLFQFQQGSRGVFWLMVNHWKSNVGGLKIGNERRKNSARAISDFFREAKADTEAMILLGDFNCEPWDEPFRMNDAKQLKAVRDRATVLSDKVRLPYFYNPMWRFLGEPDDWETAQKSEDYARPRPMGTFCGTPPGKHGWKLWDQVLITKPLLTGTDIQVLENSIQILRPISSSDHCAITVDFLY